MMTITGKIEQALPVKGLSAYETKVLAVETYQAMIAEAEQKLTEWGIEYRIDRRESETIITTETYRYCFKVQEIVLQTQNAAKQNDNG